MTAGSDPAPVFRLREGKTGRRSARIKGWGGTLFEEKPSALETRTRKQPHGDWSPAQGVCGDARLLAAAATRARAGAGQFRPSRRDYLSAPVTSVAPANARWCASATALPGLDFSYPTDLATARCAAQEQRAGAGAERLRVPACGAQAWSNGATRPSKLRSTVRRRLQELRLKSSEGEAPARPPAPPTTNSAPGPMPAGLRRQEAHCF